MTFYKNHINLLLLMCIMISVLDVKSAYAATCPAGDQMYFLTDSTTMAPSGATSQPIDWTTGLTSKTYTFANSVTGQNFTFTVALTNLQGLLTGNPKPFSGAASDAPVGSIALYYSKTSATNVVNNTVNLTASVPVSKMGFTINDLDWADSSNNGYYTEQLKISAGAGRYSSAYPTQHSVSADGKTLTAIGMCGSGDSSSLCPVNADWTDVGAGNTVKSDHLNIPPRTMSTNYHWLTYSGFYVCVAPPKILFQKQVNSLDTPTDSFNLSLSKGTTPLASIATSGTGTFKSNVTNLDSTSATYNITETASSGNLTNYTTTYQCSNGNTSSTTVLPTTSTSGTTISLTNLNLGDKITCTITNVPKIYTFSGIIFNDNGDMATDLNNPSTNTYPTTTTNTQYFNGVYDSAVEKGIFESGLQVQLASNCNTATPTIIKTADVNTDGTYSITATATEMSGATNVCVIEKEPNGNLTTYPVDTTNNQLNVGYASTTYNYPNLNFGEVSKNNEGLVLVKEQAPNDCNITGSAMLGLPYSQTTQSNIDARKCVAYKITAYNRTNLTNGLTNVQITDALPKKGVSTSTVSSALVTPADTTATNFQVNLTSGVAGAITAYGQNGIVVSDIQTLPKGASKSLYFNTKYDSTLP